MIGSVYSSIYRTHLTTGLPARLPRALGTIAHNSVGAALTVGEHLAAGGHAALAAGVQHAASDAFIKGLNAGCLVAAAVAAVGAIAAAALLPAQPIVAVDAETAVAVGVTAA